MPNKVFPGQKKLLGPSQNEKKLFFQKKFILSKMLQVPKSSKISKLLNIFKSSKILKLPKYQTYQDDKKCKTTEIIKNI